MSMWHDIITETEYMMHSGACGCEIHFMTEDYAKAKAVENECRRQIGHAKPQINAMTEHRMTNADRIRALSDEELAKFMDERNACLRTHQRTVAECENYHDCKDCWLDWLKQEAIT